MEYFLLKKTDFVYVAADLAKIKKKVATATDSLFPGLELFEAKHIKQALGITGGQLFHWGLNEYKDT